MGLFSWLGRLFGRGPDLEPQPPADPNQPIEYQPGQTLLFMAQSQNPFRNLGQEQEQPGQGDQQAQPGQQPDDAAVVPGQQPPPPPPPPGAPPPA